MSTVSNLIKSLCSPKLTGRLVIYILVVAAVPVILIAFFAFRTGSAGIQRHTNLHLKSVVSMKAQEVERWFRPLEAIAHVSVSNSSVKEAVGVLLSGDPASEVGAAREYLLRYFDDLMQRNPALQQISVMSAKRDVLLSFAASNPVSLEFESIALPLTSDPGLEFHLPPYVPGGDAIRATIAAPIPQQEGPSAYLMLQASPNSLYESLTADAALGLDGKMYLVDRQGAVLTPQRVPSSVTNDARTTELIDVSGNQFSGGLRYKDFFGVEVVGAYMPLESLGWGVAAEIPIDVAFSDIRRMRWIIVVASASFLVLLLLAAMLISRRITRPLRTLTAGAQAVGSGDLGHRIEIQSNDEIGTLAGSFNQMAKDLDTTQKRMVEAERAAALQTFTEAKVEQLKQLSRLGLLITTESSMEGLVEKTPVMAKDITGASLAALVVFSENDSYVEHVTHTQTTDSTSIEKMMRDPVFLEPLTQGHSINYEPRAIGPYSDQPAAQQYQKFKNILAVPLYAETGDVAGAITIINSANDKSFAQEDQELLQIIAGYISAALQKLHKEDGLQRSEQKALNAVEELRLAQQQLIQAQKMESIGNLAGGVAHDFNNLLTPIMGYAQLGMMALTPGQEHLRTSLLEIQSAAERASNLTRQLLAFSRRQIIEPKVINLNTLVLNMEKMLRRLIGEDVEFSTISASHLQSVKVDPGQIEQVLMNLVVNARDAIPLGGSIKVDTANVTLDLEYSRTHPEVTPGEYVSLGVSDNGTGIPDEVMEHIFEPFFTTKEEGKGTGLGLATCYGIAKQNEGHIAVYSELGQGTTFKIYLPIVEEEAINPSQRGTDDVDQLPRGTETVLLVEDEDIVRELAARVLKGQGYSVLEASNGVEALDIVEEHEGVTIDLLLTDVVMPLMGGRELANQLRTTRPGIKVLFTSGYADESITRHGVLDPDTAFTQKPFSATDLALKVREVLEKPSANEQPILEQRV